MNVLTLYNGKGEEVKVDASNIIVAIDDDSDTANTNYDDNQTN